METMHAAGRRRLPPVPRSAGAPSSTGQLTVERPRPRAVEKAVAAPAVPVDRSATELIDTRQIAAELVEAELAALSDPAPDDAAPDDTAQDHTAQDDTAQDDTAQDDTAKLDLPDVATRVEAAEDAEPESAVSDAAVLDPAVLDPAVLDPAVLEDVLLPAPADEQDPAQQFVARLRSSAADFAGAAGAESAVVREAVPPARHRRARCRLVLRYADGAETDVTLLGPAGRPGRPSRHGFDRQILRWLGSGLVRDDTWLTDDPDAPGGVAVDLTAWVAAS